MKLLKNTKHLKLPIKIFISLSLALTSIIHSEETSDNSSKSTDNSQKSTVELPSAEDGHIEHKGKTETGDDIWSVDFEKPANPGRGKGGLPGRDVAEGREGSSEDNTLGRENELGSSVGDSNSTETNSKSQGNWTKRNNKDIYDPRNSNTAHQETNKTLAEHTAVIEEIKNEAETQLEQIISQDISDQTTSSIWKNGVQTIIDQTKKQVHSLNKKAPVTQTVYMGGETRLPVKKRIIYPETIIHPLMDKTLNAINKQLEQSTKAVHENINTLKETVEDSIIFSEENIEDIIGPVNPPQSATELYDQTVTDIANDILKTKYTRRELGLLQDEDLILPPEEEPYEFLSPEGEFLDKNKAVYEKLRYANPYYEQGILAREVGLSAVEVADEEFAEGNEPEAETAFQIAETMSDIAIGLTPYVGAGKDAYELVTGKHLLTGRDLTLFERSMSGVGLILASMSGGTLSSGVVKLSIQQTNKVLHKINAKLLAKTFRSLRGSQLEKLQKYQEAFFHTVENIGLTTKRGAESSLRFIKRAFAKENPSIDEMVQAIQSTGKEGIENYTRALAEINNELKVNNLRIPESGKAFLARQIRLGYKFDQNQLVTIGKVSARAEARIGTTIQPISFPKPGQSGQIWRVVRESGTSKTTGKSFVNTPETVFDIHPSMIKESQRYSPKGKIALFTSLDKETALKEFTVRRGKNVLKKPYIVGSKTLDDFDGVLDLTDTNVYESLGISSTGDGITNIRRSIKNPNAYIVPNLLRETAERKGIKAILAPVSEAIPKGGENFIILQGGLL